MLICRRPRRTIACVMLSLVTMALSAAPAAGGFFQVSGDVFRTFGFYSSTPLGSYNASAIIAHGIGDEVIYNDTTSAPFFDYRIQSSAVSDIGGLRSQSFGRINNNEPGAFGAIPFSVGANSLARGRYDDVMITGPAGFVTTSINMSLDGSLIVQVPSLTSSGYANASVQVLILADGLGIGDGLLTVAQNALSPPYINQVNGMLTGWSNFGTITSPTFVVPTNVPFTIDVILQTSIGAGGYGAESFNTAANSGFLGTLTFSTDRPVFSLPVGYTANSVDAAIIDNMFVVPEPGTLALACWVPLLIGICWLRRRSRGHCS